MALLRIDKIVHQLYVHPSSLKSNSRCGKEVGLEFKVIPVFNYGRIFKDCLEILRGAARGNVTIGGESDR